MQLIAHSAVSAASTLLVGATAVVAFGVRLQGSLGAIAAAQDVKRAGIIASVLYFPMLLFSGTTVPFPVFPEVVQQTAVILPLRHGIELLNAAALGAPISDMLPSAAVLAAMAVAGILISVPTFRWDME